MVKHPCSKGINAEGKGFHAGMKKQGASTKTNVNIEQLLTPVDCCHSGRGHTLLSHWI